MLACQVSSLTKQPAAQCKAWPAGSAHLLAGCLWQPDHSLPCRWRTCCWQVKSEPGGMSVQMQGLGGGSSWTGEAGTPGQRPQVVWQ